jgi:GT2 family glycosyltransferase
VRLPDETVTLVLSRPLAAAQSPSDRNQQADPQTSIVVVSYNNLVFTRMCLETLLCNTHEPSFEVIVVDNGSTDGSVEYLLELGARDPRVRPMVKPTNLGFAIAVNLGLASARGSSLVILNNDVLMPPGWLKGLTAHLQDWTVGMVGPLTNRASGETRIAVHHRTYGEFLDYAATITGRRRAQRDVRALPMLCVAMSRSIFAEIGPLDPRYSVGMFEDDDYCARLRAAGYRLVCAEDVFVHHFGGASFGKLVTSGAFSAIFEENRRRYEEKWGVRWKQPANRDDPGYEALKRRLQDLVLSRVPPDSVVAVVAKGDDALVDLPGRQGMHFPQADRGKYAGWYPRHDGEAIAQLNRLRAGGCQYVVIPASSAWWLDYYKGFAAHLEHAWKNIAAEPEVGVIYGPHVLDGRAATVQGQAAEVDITATVTR